MCVLKERLGAREEPGVPVSHKIQSHKIKKRLPSPGESMSDSGSGSHRRNGGKARVRHLLIQDALFGASSVLCRLQQT